MNTAEIKYRKINYHDILKALKHYAENLIRNNKAQLVLLFGSLARGDYTGSSDADLLIITEKALVRPLDRYSDYLDPTLPIEINPIVLLENECINRLREGDSFLSSAISQAICLAGRRSLYADCQRILKE